MSAAATLVFPDLLYLSDYSGNFTDYFNAVYSVFENHFITTNPSFCGVKVTVQKYPLVDGVHRAFYYITHEGKEEGNRQPDLRRMERIRFPKFCIDSCPHEHLLIWKNQRKNDARILIFNEAEGYLTVLTERKGYNLFWTAYFVEQNHRKKKLIKEYEDYKKAKTA